MKSRNFFTCITLLSALLLTACAGNGGENETAEIAVELNDAAVTSDEDKQRQYLAYLQNYLEENVLEPLPDVESANVILSAPADADGISVSSGGELSIDVILELSDELSDYSASELADMLAKGVGNSTTDGITIMDADGVQLFP